jgi:hypothetical protein
MIAWKLYGIKQQNESEVIPTCAFQSCTHHGGPTKKAQRNKHEWQRVHYNKTDIEVKIVINYYY